MNDSYDWKGVLGLKQHPEGGYYKETYRSPKSIQLENGDFRSASTLIYFLLEGADRSLFHRLSSDEAWFFHDGCPIELVLLHEDGSVTTVLLGKNPEKHQQFHTVIPSGTWFAAKPKDPSSFSLVSCSVAPGFEFEDFELANREALIARFPAHKLVIERFTYEP